MGLSALWHRAAYSPCTISTVWLLRAFDFGRLCPRWPQPVLEECLVCFNIRLGVLYIKLLAFDTSDKLVRLPHRQCIDD